MMEGIPGAMNLGPLQAVKPVASESTKKELFGEDLDLLEIGSGRFPSLILSRLLSLMPICRSLRVAINDSN